jgi:flagellar biosynthesis protein FliP
MAHPTKILMGLAFLLSFFPANPYLEENKNVTRKISKQYKMFKTKGLK